MGRGLPRYLAALKATPQVGSDGAELARRGHLYGLPLLLESGNGRCVVTAEVNPENRASACQVGLALHSSHSKEKKKSRRQDRWVLRTLVRGDGSAARKETPPPPPHLGAVTCAFSSSPPRVWKAPRAAGVGDGELARRAGLAANLARVPETVRPSRALVHARTSLQPFPPPLQTGLRRAPAVGLCARVLFSFLSLPMATPPRVLASEPACRWPWGRCLPSWPNLWGLDLRQC